MTARVLAYHQQRRQDWVDLLAQIVVRESPTDNKAAVDQLGHYLKERLEAVGAAVTVLPQPQYGDFLRAEFGEGEGQVLVLCHFDTVWPIGQIKSMPLVERDGNLFGPGAYDMKCGVMYTLAALEAIRDLGLATRRKIVLLYNTEEEVGSPVSRPIIEAEARRSDVVLVLEPSVPPQGAVKTSRSGVGRFVIKVQGRPSHSGGDHKSGISAIDELCRVTLKLHALTDYEAGTTVNVGVIAGGTRPNVVAAEASCEVDVRVLTKAEGERVEQVFRSLKAERPEAKLTVTGGMNRPPMERTDAIISLYQQAKQFAAEMGFDLPEGHTGGGSDGNFTAALGVPTIDGLGAVGNGAHAFDEHVELAPIAQRVALLTMLMTKL